LPSYRGSGFMEQITEGTRTMAQGQRHRHPDLRIPYAILTVMAFPTQMHIINTNICSQARWYRYQIYLGWVALLWMARASGPNLETIQSSQWWTLELIKKLWNVLWDMWEQRNEALHNSALNCKQIVEKNINYQIRQVYKIGLGQLQRADFGLMWHPIEHQLNLPLNMKCQWLN